MKQFVKGTPLLIVWHFNRPDGTAFSLVGFQYKITCDNARGSMEIQDSIVNPENGYLSFTLRTDMQTANGPYSFNLTLYQNGKIMNQLVYRDAILLGSFGQGGIGHIEDAEQTVNLFSVGEFNLFNPAVPVAGADGYWYYNGNRVKDDKGRDVSTSFSIDVVTEGEKYGRIIINKGLAGEKVIDAIHDLIEDKLQHIMNPEIIPAEDINNLFEE